MAGRAIGYLRVSTDQQAESGLGLEAQEAAVRSAASRSRLDVVRVFVDAGTSPSTCGRTSSR
jgi:site-specific DNA recombinase